MKIRVISHFNDPPDDEWEGDVPLTLDMRSGPQAVLAAVYRYFNRVTPADSERLESIGYRLPSLSSGDHVFLPDGSYWRCDPVGWAPGSVGFAKAGSEAPEASQEVEDEVEAPPKAKFAIDLPDANDPGGPLINFGFYENKPAAIRAAMDYFGADRQGRINIINELP